MIITIVGYSDYQNQAIFKRRNDCQDERQSEADDNPLPENDIPNIPEPRMPKRMPERMPYEKQTLETLESKYKNPSAAEATGVVIRDNSIAEQQNPHNPLKWDQVITLYAEHYGHHPTWATSGGKNKEFISLGNVLKKINNLGGGMDDLIKILRIFLQDLDQYLVKNSHRPSLLPAQLDNLWKQLKGAENACSENRFRFPPDLFI